MKGMTKTFSNFYKQTNFGKPLKLDLPSKVNIVDVGIRGGFQTMPVPIKYILLSKLSQCGVKNIEIAEFGNSAVSQDMIRNDRFLNLINENLKPGNGLFIFTFLSLWFEFFAKIPKTNKKFN